MIILPELFYFLLAYCTLVTYVHLLLMYILTLCIDYAKNVLIIHSTVQYSTVQYSTVQYSAVE